MPGHLQLNEAIATVNDETPEFIHDSPERSDFVQIIDKNLIRDIIGKHLGICPRTGNTISVTDRYLLIIRDRDDDIAGVFHADAVASITAEFRAKMRRAGFYADARRLP